MSNVIKFNKNDISPDEVLNGAMGNLEKVVLIGFDNDGDLYIASSMDEIPELLFHLHCFRVHLDEYIRC